MLSLLSSWCRRGALILLGIWGALSLGSANAAAELSFPGKLVSPLKRPVVLPLTAVILSLEVEPGQKVKEGEVLGRYRLTLESLQNLRRRLLPSQIPELRARLAEIHKGLTLLRAREKSLRELVGQKLAAPQSLEQVEQEIKALLSQQAAVTESLRLAQKTKEAEEDLARKQLGVPIKPGQVPEEGVLLSPLEGHVLWLHPDLRVGAELPGGTPVITVGVMDPMVLRARVHEIEALKLKVGDEADLTMESLPGRTFKARVSRLPWSPAAISLEVPTYFEVEFEVPNPELILKEGLKATVEIRRSPETPPPTSRKSP